MRKGAPRNGHLDEGLKGLRCDERFEERQVRRRFVVRLTETGKGGRETLSQHLFKALVRCICSQRLFAALVRSACSLHMPKAEFVHLYSAGG